MGRIAFFILIAILLYLGWRTWRVKQIQQQKPPRRQEESNKEEKLPTHKMVRCENCGLYLDQADAIHKNGRYYCCREHMLAGPKRNAH